MNLLLVNDEVFTAESMKEIIPWKKYGIDAVYVASSAAEGRACIRQQTIDIMLCDIEMPGENGILLLRWVHENNREIKCIILTCHASFTYAQEAIGLGCQDYLLLPVKYDDIGKAVAKVANLIRQEQEEKRLREYGKAALRQTVESAAEQTECHKSPQQIVREVQQYMMEQLQDDGLTVVSIASHFYLHPVYLNRIFKKETGIPISRYLVDQRMCLAAELLKDGKISANAIAERVGYKSYSNFYNTFKKYYGYTPRQYTPD